MIDNPAPDRSLIHRRLSRIVSELEGRGRKPAELAAGDNFHLSRDAIAHVLFPPRGFAGATADDQALVIRFIDRAGPIRFVHVRQRRRNRARVIEQWFGPAERHPREGPTLLRNFRLGSSFSMRFGRA